MRFAYLIMAHNSFKLLKELVKTLDSPENDIYIHLDLKLGDIDLSEIKKITNYSNVEFIKNRVSVSWARVTIVEAILNLLEESVTHSYDYYHIMSGVDFPIKSNKKILDFFSQNNGKEFVGFTKNWEKVLEPRLAYYHLIDGNLERKYVFMRKLNSFMVILQKFLHIHQYYPIDDFQGGPAWFSITNKLALDLLLEKKNLLKKYKYVRFPDEVFLQTFIYNNPQYSNKVYTYSDNYLGCLRKIDWTKGSPYTWQACDLDELINSPYLFARKFSENDMDFIYQLENAIR